MKNFRKEDPMRKKHLKILFICILLISFTFGISGVIRLTNDEINTTITNQKDTLIGVFVTRESLDLFDMEAYLNDHAQELLSSNSENILPLEDTNKYKQRIYATPIEIEDTTADGEPLFRKEYIFPNLDGYLLCHAEISDSNGEYSTTIADDIFCDIHLGLHTTDNGKNVTLSAMIYSLPQEDGVSFFFNPVYQTENGDVYLTSGTGSSFSGEILGGTCTHTLDDRISFSNGEEETTSATTIEVSFQVVEKPDSLILTQMDANHQILTSHHYTSGEMPDTVIPLKDTAYLILETIYTDSDGNPVSSYEIYDKNDKILTTFLYKENGICVNVPTSIWWDAEVEI